MFVYDQIREQRLFGRGRHTIKSYKYVFRQVPSTHGDYITHGVRYYHSITITTSRYRVSFDGNYYHYHHHYRYYHYYYYHAFRRIDSTASCSCGTRVTSLVSGFCSVPTYTRVVGEEEGRTHVVPRRRRVNHAGADDGARGTRRRGRNSFSPKSTFPSIFYRARPAIERYLFEPNDDIESRKKNDQGKKNDKKNPRKIPLSP